MYGRFINGEFQQAPINYTTEDGVTVCNFDKNIEMLSRYGFQEVLSQPMPDLAPNQMVEPVYSLGNNGEIIESWRIVESDLPHDFDPIPQEPTEPTD